MRLSELNPKWVVGNYRDAAGLEQYSDSRSGMGLRFDCPFHRQQHRLVVMFRNPIDGGPPSMNENLWQRDGADFENISLSPSIDATSTHHDFGCWHGYIKNGEIV